MVLKRQACKWRGVEEDESMENSRKSYFDFVIMQDVFVEVHIPNRHLERVSSDMVRVPVEERLPSPYCYYIQFKEYLYNENGAPAGVKVICDLGGGYYAPDEKSEENVYPGKEVTFYHNWTGVDDDGCPEDNATEVRFRIERHVEL